MTGQADKTTDNYTPKQYYPTLIKESSKIKGRGVFATTFIEKGSIVEVAPVIELEPKDYRLCEQTFLYEYMYGWKEDGGVVALGNGSLYNHENEPNLFFTCVEDKAVIQYKATRDISPGDELTISYNQRFPSNLWFQNEEN